MRSPSTNDLAPSVAEASKEIRTSSLSVHPVACYCSRANTTGEQGARGVQRQEKRWRCVLTYRWTRLSPNARTSLSSAAYRPRKGGETIARRCVADQNGKEDVSLMSASDQFIDAILRITDGITRPLVLANSKDRASFISQTPSRRPEVFRLTRWDSYGRLRSTILFRDPASPVCGAPPKYHLR